MLPDAALDISQHASRPGRETSVVVTGVPKINGAEHNQKSHEHSHVISPFAFSRPPGGTRLRSLKASQRTRSPQEDAACCGEDTNLHPQHPLFVGAAVLGKLWSGQKLLLRNP